MWSGGGLGFASKKTGIKEECVDAAAPLPFREQID